MWGVAGRERGCSGPRVCSVWAVLALRLFCSSGRRQPQTSGGLGRFPRAARLLTHRITSCRCLNSSLGAPIQTRQVYVCSDQSETFVLLHENMTSGRF